MSIEEIAAEAGVSRPTIYLRYPGKAELATAALASYRDRGRPAETGETHADLVARLRHFRRVVECPFGMAMIGSVEHLHGTRQAPSGGQGWPPSSPRPRPMAPVPSFQVSR